MQTIPSIPTSPRQSRGGESAQPSDKGSAARHSPPPPERLLPGDLGWVRFHTGDRDRLSAARGATPPPPPPAAGRQQGRTQLHLKCKHPFSVAGRAHRVLALPPAGGQRCRAPRGLPLYVGDGWRTRRRGPEDAGAAGPASRRGQLRGWVTQRRVIRQKRPRASNPGAGRGRGRSAGSSLLLINSARKATHCKTRREPRNPAPYQLLI